MNRVISLGLAVGWGLASGLAHADSTASRATYVLSIATDEADDQADALTQALRARVREAPGFSLQEAGQSFDTLAIALKCPARPDPPCLVRIGDQLKTDRYFWGSLQKKPGSSEVAAEVHLWTRGRPDSVVRQAYPDSWKDPSAEPLRTVAGSLFAGLTGMLADSRGPSRSASDDSEAKAPPGATEGAAAQAEPASESRVSIRQILGYSALVLGGGFLVASGIEASNWIADNNASNDDRKSVPRSVTDVCASPVNAAAIDACARSRDASNVSTLGWVFAGVGAALAGTGVVLLLALPGSSQEATHDARATPPRRSSFEVVPSVGPRDGRLDVKLAF